MNRENEEGVYVNVIGHINPDTDSVCSAIAYANLKQKITGQHYCAKRAGQLNAETSFVLNYFGVPFPEYLSDVRTQVMDMKVEHVPGVSRDISLKKAWELMRENALVTLPIVDKKQKLEGLITIEDIAKSYMDVYDSKIVASAKTPFQNIIETLDGEMVTGDSKDFVKAGKCLIAAANPDLMESYIEKDDVVILGNRYESQLCAIEMDAKCIIVCDGAPVSFTITKLAESKGCYIIKTPYDTYTATRLVNQSMPIRYFMKDSDLVTFYLTDYLDDIRDTMTHKRYRDFPILNQNDTYCGMISRRSLLGARKKKIILVDHNEMSQAIDGLEEAELLEVIDHHRINSMETMGPIYFRNQPLGCTATIIYQMYRENNVEIDKKIAGLLCSAILSDTLVFRSPTCTATDERVAKELAKIADIETEPYAMNMFAAGSNLSMKSPEEIFYQDFKKYVVDDVSFGVGQITSMTKKELDSIKDKLMPYMKKAMTDHGLPMMFFMLTNILDESTELICAGNDAEELAHTAFHIPETKDRIMLQNTVSRKKQIIPAMMSVIQQKQK